MHPHLGARGGKGVAPALHRPGHGGAAGNHQPPGRGLRDRGFLRGEAQIRLEHAEHAHAVLDLREVLVGLVVRQLLPREAVELVRGEHEAGLQPRHVFPLICLRLPEQGRRGGRVIGRDRLQALAELRQPHRHQRHGLHRGMQARQILQRAPQHGPVVPPRAEHHLAVAAQAVLPQHAQPVHQLRGAGVLHHAHAHLRIGGVDGDVQRTDPAAQYAVELPVGDVRHRDEVAHHQRQPPVVVLHVEGAAQVRRHLVDEAEDAVVRAGPRGQHDGLIQRDAQRLPVQLLHLHGDLAPVPRHGQRKGALRGQRLIVDLVNDGLPGDGEQHIPRADSQPVRDGARLHMGNRTGHAIPSLCSFSVHYGRCAGECQARPRGTLQLSGMGEGKPFPESAPPR